MDSTKIWIIAVVVTLSSNGDTLKNCHNLKCICRAEDQTKPEREDTKILSNVEQENLLRQRRETLNELLTNFRETLNNEQIKEKGVPEAEKWIRSLGGDGYKNPKNRGRKNKAKYSKQNKNDQDQGPRNHYYLGRYYPNVMNDFEGNRKSNTGVVSYAENGRKYSSVGGCPRKEIDHEDDRDVIFERIEGEKQKLSKHFDHDDYDNQYGTDGHHIENQIKNRAKNTRNELRKDNYPKELSVDSHIKENTNKENNNKGDDSKDLDGNCNNPINAVENFPETSKYPHTKHFKNPNEVLADALNYLSQHHMRFDLATTTKGPQRAVTTAEEELEANKQLKDILRESNIYSYTPAPIYHKTSNNTKGFEDEAQMYLVDTFHSNPSKSFNDQSELNKNNLAHEANYKLSKAEQEAAEKRNGSFWKWPWYLAKRSVQFNPMHEIKLKTSNRLMKKGFGPSLPSNSLGENQRELMIDNMVKRREQELLKGDKSFNELDRNSGNKDNNELRDVDVEALNDLDETALDTVLSSLRTHDLNNEPSDKSRYKRATAEVRTSKQSLPANHKEKRHKREISYSDNHYDLFNDRQERHDDPSSYSRDYLNNDFSEFISEYERLNPVTVISKLDGNHKEHQQVNFHEGWSKHYNKHREHKENHNTVASGNPKAPTLPLKHSESIETQKSAQTKKTNNNASKPKVYRNNRNRAHLKIDNDYRDHSVNNFKNHKTNNNPDNRPSNEYERHPKPRNWLEARKLPADTFKETTPAAPEDNSNDLSLELRDQILNCTSYSSLKEFLKWLSKNTTTTTMSTGTVETEEIEIDFTTLDIPELLTEDPLSATTEEKEESVSNVSTTEGFQLNSSNEPETEETSTIECEDTNDNWSTDADLDSPSTESTDVNESTDTESITDDIFPTQESSPTSTLNSVNNASDVKLNIAINANVHGNSKDKNFFGNGSIHVKPGYLDDRFRRATLFTPFEEGLQNRKSDRSTQTRSCNNKDDKDNLHNMPSGKLSADIVKAVFRLVRDIPELQVLWPSLKRNQVGERPQMTNFYAIRNKDNEKQVQQSEHLLHEAMEALNNIIEQQVHSRTCLPLRPDLYHFYNQILQTKEDQKKYRDKREYNLRMSKPPSSTMTTWPDFYREINRLDPDKIEESSRTVKKLLREYENLPEELKQEVGDLKDELNTKLSQLQNSRERQRRGQVKRTYLGSLEKYNEVQKLLEKYYTPEFAKLQKASQLYRDITNDRGAGEA